MNILQTGKVLGLVAVVDNRNIDQATIAAWHDLIGDLNYADALEAVRQHRRESTEYLVPAHVRAGVQRIRGARLAAAPPPLPAVDPDDVAAYQAERRRLLTQIADGRINPNQIGA